MKRTFLSVIILAVFAALHATGQSFCFEAHRGISNRFPENTIPAFEEAAKAGCYQGLETDVQMTKDGVLVIMHDSTIDRTTNGTGKVSDYTWEELSRLEINGGFGWNAAYAGKLHIPLFTDFLHICREAGLIPYVELKCLTDDGIIKTIQTLRSEGFKDDEYVLTSFKKHYLTVAGQYSTAKREYMKDYFSHDVLLSLAGTGIVIRPNSVKIDQKLVDDCRALGFEMEAYGLPVGNAELLEQLKKWGIGGVTCNDWIF